MQEYLLAIGAGAVFIEVIDATGVIARVESFKAAKDYLSSIPDGEISASQYDNFIYTPAAGIGAYLSSNDTLMWVFRRLPFSYFYDRSLKKELAKKTFGGQSLDEVFRPVSREELKKYSKKKP